MRSEIKRTITEDYYFTPTIAEIVEQMEDFESSDWFEFMKLFFNKQNINIMDGINMCLWDNEFDFDDKTRSGFQELYRIMRRAPTSMKRPCKANK